MGNVQSGPNFTISAHWEPQADILSNSPSWDASAFNAGFDPANLRCMLSFENISFCGSGAWQIPKLWGRTGIRRQEFFIIAGVPPVNQTTVPIEPMIRRPARARENTPTSVNKRLCFLFRRYFDFMREPSLFALNASDPENIGFLRQEVGILRGPLRSKYIHMVCIRFVCL
jgi:hypothetical protein